MGQTENHDSDDKQAAPTQSIVAKFGGTIRNVTQIINNQVNEKVIKRLGLEQRIGFALVYGLVIVATISLFFALRNALLPSVPTRMTGEFNIAISEFGLLGENGQVQESDSGKELSEKMFGRVDEEMKGQLGTISVQIWHNSIDRRLDLGVIRGQTREERAESASALAERIGAHVIIYGNLTPTDSAFHFAPEFYVAQLPEAGELLGAHQLGSEIPIPGSLEEIGTVLVLNEELSARTRALSHFVIGLAWETVGQPDRALEQFNQAGEITGWEDDEGKEILYLFIGREASFLWRAGEDRSEEMRAAFEEAIRINPQYGRAYIGLGNYHRHLADDLYDLVRALRLEEGEAVDSEKVVEAADRFFEEAELAAENYRQALQNIPFSPASLLETKVHLALGGVHNRHASLLLLVGNIDEEFDEAETYLEMALEHNETALQTVAQDDYQHVGLARLGIALAHHQKAYVSRVRQDTESSQISYQKALESYTACIESAAEDTTDWFLQQFSNEQCVPGKQDVETALAGLEGE